MEEQVVVFVTGAFGSVYAFASPSRRTANRMNGAICENPYAFMVSSMSRRSSADNRIVVLERGVVIRALYTSSGCTQANRLALAMRTAYAGLMTNRQLIIFVPVLILCGMLLIDLLVRS
jgi:hypothetical protein